MSEVAKSSFRFINFFIKESHIIQNSQGEFQIDINFAPKGYILKALNQFHLEMSVTIKEKTDKFNIQITAVGYFEFDEGANIEAYKSKYFTTNAPAILYPYIRAYVSTLTSQAGVFNVLLPTYNLTPLADILTANTIEIDQDVAQ